MKNLPTILAAAFVGLCAVQQAQAGPQVKFETTKGDFTVELNEEKAPITVKNFLQYVDDGHFNGIAFHRVIEGFMVQTGGFAVNDEGVLEQKKSRENIQNEAKNGLKNIRGSLAMARTSDPHSASAQFFINHGDNDNLDYPSFDGWGYAVFGKVTEGMDVVDAIAAVETTVKTVNARSGEKIIPNPSKDVPVEDVLVKSAKRVEAPAKAE